MTLKSLPENSVSSCPTIEDVLREQERLRAERRAIIQENRRITQEIKRRSITPLVMEQRRHARNERQRQLRHEKREQILAIERRYYQTHREKKLARNTAYRRAHLTQTAAYMRA